MAGTLKVTRRSDLVKIAPDAEHISRTIVGRPVAVAIAAQTDKVYTVDKGIDDADKAIRSNIIINAGGAQARLGSVSSFDEPH